ncbi:MAG: glutamate cyclase domain-containing protein, partial [Planctomycetaceae bacterium]
MDVAELERWIHRDPTGRGFLTAFDAVNRPCAGDLREAAAELASRANSVGIVTGFFVPDAPKPAAETDGPLGAILLADVLSSFGAESFLITDERCFPAVHAAMKAGNVDCELLVCPVPSHESQRWRDSFWDHPRRERLTHLISVERIGPAITAGADRDECRNMRGAAIDAWSADLYRLFEQHPPHVRTIGIGDGGNEIGMGRYWEQVRQTRPVPPNASRTATELTFHAGVSDWGA